MWGCGIISRSYETTIDTWRAKIFALSERIGRRTWA